MTTWTMITEQDVRVYAEIHYMEARFGGADHLPALVGVMKRSEIVRFLVNSYVQAALHETDSEEQYEERTHSLFIDGFPEDEWTDEFSDEDAEKRKLLAEMEAIRAEAQAEVAVHLAAAKVKAAEAEKRAKEQQVLEQRAFDLRRLAELERQKAELQAKIQEGVS